MSPDRVLVNHEQVQPVNSLFCLAIDINFITVDKILAGIDLVSEFDYFMLTLVGVTFNRLCVLL